MLKLTSEEAAVLLSDIADDWKAFWFSHGPVARNVRDLAAALGAMNDEQFVHHVNPEKNDLAAWMDEVVGDKTLAAKLRLLRTLAATHTMVTRRVTELEVAAAPTPKAGEPLPTVTVLAVAEETASPAASTETVAPAKDAPKKRAPKAAAPKAKQTLSKSAGKAADKAKTASVWSRLLKR